MISSLSERSQYSCLTDVAYLNQASLGLICQPAVSAMHVFLDDVARHGNLRMSDAEEVAFFTPLRDRAATLMNTAPERLAIVSSAGEMLSQLPYLMRPRSGSKIVTVSSDFPAITRPWIAWADANGNDLDFVDEDPDRDLTDAIVQNIDDRTSVVAVSFVQFSTGTRVDVLRLREATRLVGAMLIVDVTQAAGAIPVEADDWDADVIVCSGYKWLGGHGGVGFAVMSPEFLNQTPPAPGWMGAPDPFDMQATRLPLANDARRYTQSTMSYISINGLTVALGQLLALGPLEIERHANKLARFMIEELDGTDWMPFRSLDDVAATSHIVTLACAGEPQDSVIERLEKNKVVCSNRNGRIRVSLAHFNDESDVRSLVNVLRQV